MKAMASVNLIWTDDQPGVFAIIPHRDFRDVRQEAL